MSKSLNPKAKVFVPTKVARREAKECVTALKDSLEIRKELEKIRKMEEEESDIIYVNRGGKIETILSSQKERDDTYRLNVLQPYMPKGYEYAYSGMFQHKTLNEIMSYLRGSEKSICLDVLYEATRERQHLDCMGVLILLAVQKGETLENCEQRVWQAFSDFYQYQDYNYSVLLREVQWARFTLNGR
jgi:hypothetical protein